MPLGELEKIFYLFSNGIDYEIIACFKSYLKNQ